MSWLLAECLSSLLYDVPAADLTVLAHVKFQILLGKRNPDCVNLSARKNFQLIVVSGELYASHQGSSSSKISPFTYLKYWLERGGLSSQL